MKTVKKKNILLLSWCNISPKVLYTIVNNLFLTHNIFVRYALHCRYAFRYASTVWWSTFLPQTGYWTTVEGKHTNTYMFNLLKHLRIFQIDLSLKLAFYLQHSALKKQQKLTSVFLITRTNSGLPVTQNWDLRDTWNSHHATVKLDTCFLEVKCHISPTLKTFAVYLRWDKNVFQYWSISVWVFFIVLLIGYHLPVMAPSRNTWCQVWKTKSEN